MGQPGRLADKVAVITGGASGIGEGTVRRFVQEGACVVIADIQHERGEALAAELGDATRFAMVDVTDEDQVAAACDLAVGAFGGLDCIFNNAGVVGVVGPIAETPADKWRLSIDILLTGVFLGTKHAARIMIPQGRGGSIISTASTAGITGGLGPHAYTAAKHAVVGLTKTVASELAQYRIRVNAIAPGSIATPLTADVVAGDAGALDTVTAHIAAGSALGRAGVPADIANAALYLASDEASYVSGHTLVVDAAQTTGAAPSRFAAHASTTYLEAGKRA
jgi:NAD(P)-dependent dehydrogenase (short-subunit alcohol dehydrogenase family)